MFSYIFRLSREGPDLLEHVSNGETGLQLNNKLKFDSANSCGYTVLILLSYNSVCCCPL